MAQEQTMCEADDNHVIVTGEIFQCNECGSNFCLEHYAEHIGVNIEESRKIYQAEENAKVFYERVMNNVRYESAPYHGEMKRLFDKEATIHNYAVCELILRTLGIQVLNAASKEMIIVATGMGMQSGALAAIENEFGIKEFTPTPEDEKQWQKRRAELDLINSDNTMKDNRQN